MRDPVAVSFLASTAVLLVACVPAVSPISSRMIGTSGPYDAERIARGAASVFWSAITPPGTIFKAPK